MIFISGVHGVGKTYFCNLVYEQFHISSYTASQLISEEKKCTFEANKFVIDINNNQQFLLSAIEKLKIKQPTFILDGHFCLLNESGEVTRISEKTFIDLNPDAIIVLTENPQVITKRRKKRDGINVNTLEIQIFQEEEKSMLLKLQKN